MSFYCKNLECESNWYKIAQIEEQQHFDFHSDPKYQMDAPYIDLIKKNGQTPEVLEEILEDMHSYVEILNALKKFGFNYEEIDLKEHKIITVSFPGSWSQNSVYVIDDFEDPDLTHVRDWVSNVTNYGRIYNYVDVPDFNQEYWDGVTNGAFVYHATQQENKEKILKDGISKMDKSRGINNRFTGSAVFTSDNPDDISSYGTVIFRIDVGAMKNDGYMPVVQMEGPLQDAVEERNLAARLGDTEYDPVQSYESEGLYETTIVFFGNIPPKYLSIYEERELTYKEKYVRRDQ